MGGLHMRVKQTEEYAALQRSGYSEGAFTPGSNIRKSAKRRRK